MLRRGAIERDEFIGVEQDRGASYYEFAIILRGVVTIWRSLNGANWVNSIGV